MYMYINLYMYITVNIWMRIGIYKSIYGPRCVCGNAGQKFIIREIHFYLLC